MDSAFPGAIRVPTTWLARAVVLGLPIVLAGSFVHSGPGFLPTCAWALQNCVGFCAQLTLLGAGAAVLLAPPAASRPRTGGASAVPE